MGEWLRFNNRDFNLDSRKEFKKILVEIQRKEIERPEALYIEEFAALYKELHSKTLINSVMLALGRVTRLLLLKRGTSCLGFKSKLSENMKGEAKHDDEAVYRGLSSTPRNHQIQGTIPGNGGYVEVALDLLSGTD
ncbi:hypothetical protein Tco_0003682 [Tanacetum coccineum]